MATVAGALSAATSRSSHGAALAPVIRQMGAVPLSVFAASPQPTALGQSCRSPWLRRGPAPLNRCPGRREQAPVPATPAGPAPPAPAANLRLDQPGLTGRADRAERQLAPGGGLEDQLAARTKSGQRMPMGLGPLRLVVTRKIGADRLDRHVGAGFKLWRFGQANLADVFGELGRAQLGQMDGVETLPFQQAEDPTRRQMARLLPQGAVGLVSRSETALAIALSPEERRISRR